MTLDEAISGILIREGSTFTDDPQDHPTKYGIDLPTYRDAGHPDATADTITALTEVDARTFYAAWLKPFADIVLPDRAWVNVLDAVTLHGRAGAVMAIQRAVNVDVDGVIGSVTLAALHAMPIQNFLFAFAIARLRICTMDLQRDLTKRYGSNVMAASDLKYLAGWQRRIVTVAFGA